MSRYYTRVCNFYYGTESKILVRKKKALPLNGKNEISFDKIEIISRNSKKIISINQINDLPELIQKKIKFDIELITRPKKKFKNLNFKSYPNIMGILNITPDSFSDGGKFNQINLAQKQLNFLFESGADLVDIGGESTRPGSKSVNSKVEWSRIEKIFERIDKKNS